MHALATKIIRLTILTAVMAAMTVIAYDYHQQAHAQANTPPAFSTISADTQLKYLFPTGAPAKLAFEGEPATDAQNDPITYRFVFNLPNLETTDVVNDHILVGPSEALFDVSQNGNAFEIEAASGATPHAFREAYGDVTSYDITVDVYANDGTADSVPISFILEAVYDPSARFQSPASSQSHNRWEITTPFETYEGPGAASDIEIQWHASEHSSNRRWSAGIAEASPVWCWDGTGHISTAVSSLWPGPDHTRPRPPAHHGRPRRRRRRAVQREQHGRHHGRAPDGHSRKVARHPRPDCSGTKSRIWRTQIASRRTSRTSRTQVDDADADNVYHLRIVNEIGPDHETALPDADKDELGCSGSALDISVKVKDVGPPAPPTGLKLKNVAGKIDIDWDSPAPNQFMEAGQLVDFPHSSFNTQLILLENEPATLTFPWQTSLPWRNLRLPVSTRIPYHGDPKRKRCRWRDLHHQNPVQELRRHIRSHLRNHHYSRAARDSSQAHSDGQQHHVRKRRLGCTQQQ